MTTRTIAVVSAGLSDPSSTSLLADRLAQAVTAALKERGEQVVVEVIELRQLAHDLTNNLLTFFASERLQAAKDTVAGADGIIAVTPIFSASYNGLFKTFFDLLEPGSLEDAPVLIGRRPEPRATHWRWSTPCGRCSPTSRGSWCRLVCSRRRRTGVQAPR
jgi:FMN reductase